MTRPAQAYRRRLHAVDFHSKRAPLPWKVRGVLVLAWCGFVVVGTVVVAVVLGVAYGLFLLGQNVVLRGSGW